MQGSLTLLEVEGDQGLLFIRGMNFGNRPMIFLSGVILDIVDRHPVATCIRLPNGSVVAACEEIVAAVPDPLPIDLPRGIGPRHLVLKVATGPIAFWPRPQTESVDVIINQFVLILTTFWSLNSVHKRRAPSARMDEHPNRQARL